MSPVILTSATSWENKHETYRQAVQGLYLVQNLPRESADPLTRYNETTRALQTLIANAQRDQVRLRAYGGGWSFSGAPSTDGRLLDTSALNLWFSLGDSSIAPNYQGQRDSLTFLQCGNSIAGISRNLRLKQRSLRTTGASNGQSIVGAMSTGTHGAAIDVGAIQDYVVGIHLIRSPESHVWLERQTYPVVTDAFVNHIGAQRLPADDEVFNAALVGFGAFGVIHGVMIETEPLFLFEMHRRRMKLEGALEAAIAASEFGGLGLPRADSRPYHFEVVVNPHDINAGVFVTVMYKRPYRVDYTPPSPSDAVAGDNALAFIGTMTDQLPEVIPKAVNLLFGGKYKETRAPVEGTTSEMFPVTTTRGKAAGTAIAVPAERAVELLRLALKINADHGPFPCILALRFVRGTQALLGFTRFRKTCVMDIDGPLSNRTRSYYSRVWQALATSGIPYTMHWGKILGLSAAEVRRLYGANVDRWRNVRRDLLGDDLWTFSNRFLEELGLDK